MQLKFKRTMGFGDIIMLSGCIAEERRRYDNPTIILQTNFPEISTLVDVDIAVNWDMPAGVVCDMDGVYERRRGKDIAPPWIAYADFLFEKYDVQSILPVLKEGQPCGAINQEYAVIHPSVSSRSRTISKGVWEMVCAWLSSRGIQPIVIGSGKDYVLYHGINKHGEYTLAQIKTLIEGAKMFVGMDSGIMHIAQGTKTPIVAVFTIADPINRIWRPENTNVILGKCFGCLSNKIGAFSIEDCENNLICTDISSKQVLKVIKGLL